MRTAPFALLLAAALGAAGLAIFSASGGPEFSPGMLCAHASLPGSPVRALLYRVPTEATVPSIYEVYLADGKRAQLSTDRVWLASSVDSIPKLRVTPGAITIISRGGKSRLGVPQREVAGHAVRVSESRS